MNARTPFTKPLTGSEMREIQRRISETTHGLLRRGGPQLITHEQMVAEVEGAIAFANATEERAAEQRARYHESYAARRRQRYHEQQAAKRGSFPPLCKVPPNALGALGNA